MASPDHDLGGCRDRDRGLDICRHSVRHRPLPVCPHPPVPGQHEGTGEYLVYSLTLILMSIIFIIFRMQSIGVPIAMQWWEDTRQSFEFYNGQNIFPTVSKDFQKTCLFDLNDI